MVKPSLSSERKQHLFRQILDAYKAQTLITRKGLAITNALRPATVTQLDARRSALFRISGC